MRYLKGERITYIQALLKAKGYNQINKEMIQAVITADEEFIRMALLSGESVVLGGIGKFNAIHKKPTKARTQKFQNIVTKEIQIAEIPAQKAYTTYRFSINKSVLRAIRENTTLED